MEERQTVLYESGTGSTPDFSFFVTKPIVPSDVTLSNGSDSWSFHKAVLRKVSPVFADILDGDKTLTTIDVGDIPTESIDIFQKFLYTKPNERSELQRDKEFTFLEDTYEVSEAGGNEVNGIYVANGKQNGYTKYTRQAGGKSYEISVTCEIWWIFRNADDTMGADIDFYKCTLKIDGDIPPVPPTSGWSTVLPTPLPLPTVAAKVIGKANYPLDVPIIIGLHTILAKYDLNLPELKDYMRWIYRFHWTPNIQEFSTLLSDVLDKNMKELVDIAVKTQIENFDANTVAEYPIWFQKAALKNHNHKDFATIVGMVSKKALRDDNDDMVSLVQQSMSTRSAEFKASVLDVQLRPHKRRRLN